MKILNNFERASRTFNNEITYFAFVNILVKVLHSVRIICAQISSPI